MWQPSRFARREAAGYVEAMTEVADKAGGGPARRRAKRGAKRRRPLRRLLRLAALGVLAVIALPIVLVPVYKVLPPPASTLELWQRLQGVPIQKQWVSFEQIAPVLAHAVLMSEDGQFCTHHGVDWDELRGVLRSDSERLRGASTIPMQVAKNLFLWPSRSYLRKALEFPLALYMDYVWPKRRMMEIYLNVVEWGPGVFGAEAAARHWFGVSAAQLSRAQAARLAAALPNPHARNPARPGPGTERIARVIEGRAAGAGAYVGCLR